MIKIITFLRKHKIVAVILIPIGLILLGLAKFLPVSVVEFYSLHIYPLFVKTFGSFISLLPFSVFELIIILIILSILISIVILIIKLIQHKFTRTMLVKCLARYLSLTSILFFLFVLFCGINYHRYEFAEVSGLTVRPSTVSELSELCESLAQTANIQREELKDTTNGMNDMYNENTANIASDAVSRLYDIGYETMFKANIKPKPVIFSEVMSYMNITGIYLPFTIEANVNDHIVEYNIPATMCHELVHTRGYMREDEANFIAYLACVNSGNIQFEYSGTMLALVHSMNRLYEVDYDSFVEIHSSYSDDVRADFKSNSDYWVKYETVIAEVATKANDTYLKANSQTDGVQGYGRMVDLLLADYRDKAVK